MAYEAAGIAIFVFLVLVTIIVFIWLLCVSYGYSGSGDDSDDDDDNTTTQNNITTQKQNIQTTAQDLYNSLNYPALTRNYRQNNNQNSGDPVFNQKLSQLKNTCLRKSNRVIQPLPQSMDDQMNNCITDTNAMDQNYNNCNNEIKDENNYLSYNQSYSNSKNCGCSNKDNKTTINISDDTVLSSDISSSSLILFNSNRTNIVTLPKEISDGTSLNFWNNSPVIQKIKSDKVILDDNFGNKYLELNSGEFITLLNANSVWLITNKKGKSSKEDRKTDTTNNRNIFPSMTESSDSKIPIKNTSYNDSKQNSNLNSSSSNSNKMLTIDEQLKLLLSSDLKI